ncbi:MAG TPA: RHS repeat-associated core domain-containing protein [Chloroflexota bacterium]|nr:RHS repeat-associated core domain-containing protein [Chloroflexota bacterium]
MVDPQDGWVPLFDGLGSERTVTDGTQAVTGTLNLDAFGNQVGSTGSSSSPYTFAATSGYRNDGDAGLTHVGARYYDAQVGRFITRDTDLSETPYLYCDHDPVNATDPSGHSLVDIIADPPKAPPRKPVPPKPLPYPFPDIPVVRAGAKGGGGISIDIPPVKIGAPTISITVEGDIDLRKYWILIPPDRQKNIKKLPDILVDWYHSRIIGDWPLLPAK